MLQCSYSCLPFCFPGVTELEAIANAVVYQYLQECLCLDIVILYSFWMITRWPSGKMLVKPCCGSRFKQKNAYRYKTAMKDFNLQDKAPAFTFHNMNFNFFPFKGSFRPAYIYWLKRINNKLFIGCIKEVPYRTNVFLYLLFFSFRDLTYCMGPPVRISIFYNDIDSIWLNQSVPALLLTIF
jgi:hypothetical protein